MKLSVAEFKTEVDRYLELAEEEEIVLTKDGRQIVRIGPAPQGFADYLISLRGILPETATVEEAHEERMAKHERHL